MAATFSLTMHPASEGDCSTLSWDDGDVAGRALVDLGRTKDYRALVPRLNASRWFDLFVITHIDADHIEGAMPLVREKVPSFDPGEVWFNGYHHLVEARDRATEPYETFSAGQGEKLSNGIIGFGWRDRWNRSFQGRAVSVEAEAAKARIDFGGMKLALLSPTYERLAALEPVWLAELRKLGLLPLDPDKMAKDQPGEEIFDTIDVEALASERFGEDEARPNGSSIAFLAEFDGKRVLMGADAHPSVLAASLRRLGASETSPLPVDLVKVSHHGSKANTSPELLELVDCHRYAFSTDGTKHGHPDGQTIARILKQEAKRREVKTDRPVTQFYFNFRQPRAVRWDTTGLKGRYRFRCNFPSNGENGIIIAI